MHEVSRAGAVLAERTSTIQEVGIMAAASVSWVTRRPNSSLMMVTDANSKTPNIAFQPLSSVSHACSDEPIMAIG